MKSKVRDEVVQWSFFPYDCWRKEIRTDVLSACRSILTKKLQWHLALYLMLGTGKDVDSLYVLDYTGWSHHHSDLFL
jgi:hypothetical protein